MAKVGVDTVNPPLPDAPRLDADTVPAPTGVLPRVWSVVWTCPAAFVVPLAFLRATLLYVVPHDTARFASGAPLESVTVAVTVEAPPAPIDDGETATATFTPSIVHDALPEAPDDEAVSVAAPAAVAVVDFTVVENCPDAFVVPLAAANDTPDLEVDNVTARPARTAPLESFTVAVTVAESPRTDDDGETATATATVLTNRAALALAPPTTADTVTVPAARVEATVSVERKVPSDCVTPVDGENDTPATDDSVTACPTTAAPAALLTVTTTDEVPPATTDVGDSTIDIAWPDAATAGDDAVITMAGTATADAPRTARRGIPDDDAVEFCLLSCGMKTPEVSGSQMGTNRCAL